MPEVTDQENKDVKDAKDTKDTKDAEDAKNVKVDKEVNEDIKSSKINLDFFEDDLSKLGLSLDDDQKDIFYKYYQSLVTYNNIVNLTSITDFHEVFIKHFVDSLSIVKILDINKCTFLIDMGTGAGFPGLPIKIMFPDLKVVLVDSLQKRVDFLNAVIEQCNIKDISVIHSRAEDLCRTDNTQREKYDLCVSRAVAKLNVLEEYCLPYVKIGGHFISYKSGNSSDEINEANNAVKKLGGKIVSSETFVLPNSDIARCLVDTVKLQPTNSKFPRKAGTPSKKPLM